MRTGDFYTVFEEHYIPTVFGFPIWLWTERKKARRTRKQMASFLGVSADTVKSWETGRRKPSETARRWVFICVAFPDVAARVATWFKLEQEGCVNNYEI